MNGIKPDPDVKAETGDRDLYMDDEFYEDTGELAMPKTDEPEKNVWLTRIPEWLYDAVSKWDDLAEGNDDDRIQIGEVYAHATTSGIDKSQSMRVFLNDRWRTKTNLPTAFQLDPTKTSDQVLGNTYVFTEKDLPGYRPSGYNQGNRGGVHGGYGAVQDPKSRVQKRSRYKKAIPKHTALLGHATRHYTANPLETKEYRDFSAARIKQAIQGSHTKVNITKETDVTNYNTLQKRFDSFIKPTTKGKAQQNKAARVSREDLIDMLHAAFDEFQYWPMKALKMRTKQPEQFLKETLAEIAQLVRSGPFASTWQRQPMFNAQRNLTQQVQAAAVADGPDGGDSDGEEEMEDVV
ncbi:transcription initiation factor IIF, beta subunit-domain-containing protein [Ampelomyces quisqualis]|uniref:Transcription initiation factor IIF subunit beta n=1 Tax=Ampelomyces quisqualis TaxID=50730 RepID=A0A6A5QCY2_AMPQU|nr:transcription initiation factor IIF, beta subunit-domain-containing protein [Ampelomyces quisqualis]